jgi:hypothetical protein
MIQPGIYTLKFQAPGFYDLISDPIQINSYFSNVTFNAQMIPVIPIPVELYSFTASVIQNDVTLDWVTATETNNKGFEIQRSLISDEKKNSEWQSIGFVNGNGTTTEYQSYSFTDKNLANGRYKYRLKQIDLDGTFNFSREIEVIVNTPNIFSLEQNYPNPFNPTTSIQYAINSRQLVQLKVYDVLGNEVVTLVNEQKEPGYYEVEFNATQFSSGVYFYRLQAGDFVQTKKMILMR